MTWSASPIAQVTGSSATGNGFDTSGSLIDTSGADTIFVALSWYALVNTATFSDSKGNTWVPLTQQGGTGGALDSALLILYAKNATVGAGHYFTVSGAATYAAIEVAAFSGGDLTAPFDAENGSPDSGSSVTTIQPGSVMPSTNDQIVFSGLSMRGFGAGTTTATINSSFALLGQISAPPGGTHIGGYSAFIIQTTAGAVNPTWTVNTADRLNAAIATFKAAGGGGGVFIPIIGRGPGMALVGSGGLVS